MLQRWNQAIKQSFKEMKEKATPEQTRCIFDNLSLLQHSIQSIQGNLKRDCTSQEKLSITPCMEDCSQSPWKKVAFQESSFRKTLYFQIIIFPP
jgi:hypothetical protein